MQHEQDIKKILYRYDYDFSNIKFKSNVSSVIEQISSDLIQKSISVKVSKSIMGDLWRFEKSLKREDLKNGSLKNVLNQIKSETNYRIDNDSIIYQKKILCKTIKESNTIHFLDQNQINQVTKLGYGIKSFKILIDENINDISCIGKHPNLSSNSDFCWDDNLRETEFTLNNLYLIETMLSQFNLDSCFIDKDEHTRLVKIATSGNNTGIPLQ